MLAAIRLVRPSYVIVENVAALLDGDLGVVLGDLAALGYDAEWHCIPAVALGYNHERDRVWIIAHAEGVRRRWGRDGWTFSQSDELKRLGEGKRRPREAQPRPVGVADGIPDWSHRIGALGNSVIPDIPEIIGKAILQAEGLNP